VVVTGTFVSLGLLVLATAPLSTPREKEVEARENEAKQACASGQLDEGVRILAQLFAETEDGNYMFNQARCYQQNGRTKEASLRFRAYLRRPDADPEASAWAQRYLAEHEAGQRAPVVPEKADPIVSTQAPPAAPPDTGRTLRIAGLTSVSLGLAALGGATYFGLRTTAYEKRAENLQAGTNPDTNMLDQIHKAGKRAELLEWVLLGVGATTVSTGALLYFLGLRTEPAARAALMVTPVPGNGARAVFRTTF
jgi:hypothetical protein